MHASGICLAEIGGVIRRVIVISPAQTDSQPREATAPARRILASIPRRNETWRQFASCTSADTVRTLHGRIDCFDRSVRKS
jgi:hypothetical protein